MGRDCPLVRAGKSGSVKSEGTAAQERIVRLFPAKPGRRPHQNDRRGAAVHGLR